ITFTTLAILPCTKTPRTHRAIERAAMNQLKECPQDAEANPKRIGLTPSALWPEGTHPKKLFAASLTTAQTTRPIRITTLASRSPRHRQSCTGTNPFLRRAPKSTAQSPRRALRVSRHLMVTEPEHEAT